MQFTAGDARTLQKEAGPIWLRTGHGKKVLKAIEDGIKDVASRGSGVLQMYITDFPPDDSDRSGRALPLEKYHVQWITEYLTRLGYKAHLHDAEANHVPVFVVSWVEDMQD